MHHGISKIYLEGAPKYWRNKFCETGIGIVDNAPCRHVTSAAYLLRFVFKAWPSWSLLSQLQETDGLPAYMVHTLMSSLFFRQNLPAVLLTSKASVLAVRGALKILEASFERFNHS